MARETPAALVDLEAPEPQTRAAFTTRYADGTLREKPFPGAGPLLLTSHPGTGFRRTAPEDLRAAS